MKRPGIARAMGLLLGAAADRLLADPRRGHPVAGFGGFAARLEQLLYRDHRSRGVVHTTVSVGAVIALAVQIERWSRRSAPLYAGAVATATWAVLGGRSLQREAASVDNHLAAGDLPAARRRITHLVGRDPTSLTAAQLSRAAVESVAENTSDAVVAPLVWGAIAGIPGLLGYRAINTLDAMVGHRSDRYRNFGWAAARLDDAANLLPARLSALLAAISAPLVGGSSREALATVRRDAGRHPSPNAGQVEAAFAGALGIQLGGVNVYGGVADHRGHLGTGAPPTVADIQRATRLSAAVGRLAAVVAAITAVAIRRRR